MKISEGLDLLINNYLYDDDCLLIEKLVCGLVQATRQFHRKLIDIMVNKMNFDKCLTNKCLLIWTTGKINVMVCVCIDNTLCAGDQTAIDGFKREFKIHVNTRKEGHMEEYVGCKVKN